MYLKHFGLWAGDVQVLFRASLRESELTVIESVFEMVPEEYARLFIDEDDSDEPRECGYCGGDHNDVSCPDKE